MKLTILSLLALAPLAALAFEPDVVIDANAPVAPSTVTLTGSWGDEVAPNLANAFRGSSKVAAMGTTGTHALFKTRLPKAGPYSVFVWHNGGTSYFGYNCPAQVTHADSTPTTVTLNQYSYPGQWLLLGTYWFEGNDDGSNTCKEAEVKISGNGYSKLSADAVRFMRATPDLVLDSDTGGTAVTFTPNATTWPSAADKAGNSGAIRRAVSTAGATVAYTFPVPVRGDYEVSIWLPGNAGTWLGGGSAATSFAVEIQHPTAAGQNPPASTTVTVNLPTVGTNEGRWVQIINPATVSADAPRTGTFRFLATAANVVNKVTIKTVGATGAGAGPWQVPADAVRISKVGDFAAFMDEDDSPFPPVPGVAGTSNWTNNPTSSTALNARAAAEWNRVQFGPKWKSFYFSSSAQGPANLTYSPLIPELGLYDIYLWYPIQDYMAYYNNPSTKLTVQTATNPPLSVTLNQQASTGMWRHAGRVTLRPSDYSNEALRPKLTLATPVNPYAPGSYQYSSWFYSNQGHVLADGVLFLRDTENADSDGDGVMDWYETLMGTNPNGGTNDYNYLALTLGQYPEAASLSVTVTAPAGAVIQ